MATQLNIFTPVGTAFTGGSFGHATVAGAGLTAILTNTAGLSVLAEKPYRAGHVIFGGFTLPFAWSPQPQGSNLLANIVAYGASLSQIPALPQVAVFERLHIREVTPELIGGPVDIVVADLSFISLSRVLDPLVRAALPGGHLVLLVKPQFEAGKVEVAKAHGVITDPAIHERVKVEVHGALEERGCTVLGWTDSPITGADGNREFLVHATTDPTGCTP